MWAAVPLVADMVAELQAAMALQVESGVDTVSAVELMVPIGSGLALALLEAMGALASLCVPLEASKRSPSTRISSLL